MPKINQEEYEVLKELDNKWKWIARDEAQQTYAYEYRPIKSKLRGQWESNWNDYYLLPHDWLQFIQWEDEEPYNISDLIEEYESEETEVKNIEWLKDEILTDMRYLEGNREIRQLDIKYQTLREVAQKINSLDEPEVLSQEFIDKYKVDYDNWMPAVPIVHLQNLLVPKQKLPVIPKFVAEVIEEHKERGYDVYDSIDLIIETNGGGLPSISNWVARNIDKYARAWLDGYEVAEEREQKYYAKIKGHENIGSNDKYWNYNTDMEELSVGDSEVHPNVISEYVLKATKDEWANLGITDDNADFVKIEELEEC